MGYIPRPYLRINKTRSGEIAQTVKAFATRPDDLNSILGTHTAERKSTALGFPLISK